MRRAPRDQRRETGRRGHVAQPQQQRTALDPRGMRHQQLGIEPRCRARQLQPRRRLAQRGRGIAGFDRLIDLRCSQPGSNRGQDAVDVLHHIGVRDVYDGNAQCRQRSVALGIGLWRMRIAIHLDRQFPAGAIEIQDMLAEDLLSPKLRSGELPVTQRAP